MFRFVAGFALLLSLVGCGDQSSDDDTHGSADKASLAGRTLVVTSIDNGGEPWGLAEGSEARFTFDDTTMGITAGCNNLSGNYRLDEDRLIVDGIGGTEMGCSKPLMKQDAWLASLFEVPVTVGEDPLTFTSGIVVLRLADREDVSPDRPIVGTRWRVDGLVSGDAVSSMPQDVDAWIEIADDGTVTVNTGCNQGSGPVTIGSGSLTFGELSLTRKLCKFAENGGQEVEQTMLRVLAGEAAYQIEERSLSITKGQAGLNLRAD
jgi:heat shock protein HslJ